MRTARWLAPLVLAAIALGAAAWLFSSVGEMHDRLAKHSNGLALVFLGIAGLLAAGDVRQAAEEYPGPLLPGSEAPGVVRERDHLDNWLRQAVLTADDPEAVWAWVNSPSGEDDLNAWKRLLAQLDYRDPRRSLCAARVAELRRLFGV